MVHSVTSTWTDLTADLNHAGYYPELVCDVLETVVAGESVLAYLVLPETTFDAAEVRRHLTVLVVTPSRLVTSHIDDHPADRENPSAAAAVTTESVRLEEIHSVSLGQIIAEPEKYEPGKPPAEVTLAIGWGAVRRIDLEPAQCADPHCEADHGYTGQSVPDDVVVRVSADAEGLDAVRSAIAFSRALSAVAGRPAA